MKSIDLSKTRLQHLSPVEIEEIRCLTEKDSLYPDVESYRHMFWSSPEIVKRCLGLDDIASRIRDFNLSALQGIYQFANKDVVKFLNKNGFIVELLEEAVPIIKEHFGADVEVFLELSCSHDNCEVFARIATRLKPKEALAILDRFDEQWWFDVSPRAKCLLNFALRYV